MTLWLVGEAPAQGFDGRPAFSSSSGQRITQLIGMDVRSVFRCVNLLDRWPGKSDRGKGSEFPLNDARLRALKYSRRLFMPGDELILAGGRVADAFRVRKAVEHFEWTDLCWGTDMKLDLDDAEQIRLSTIPHPSGVNRFWNSPDNVQTARTFLVEALSPRTDGRK